MENIFPPDARMELIEGEIIDMAPIGLEWDSSWSLPKPDCRRLCRQAHFQFRRNIDTIAIAPYQNTGF